MQVVANGKMYIVKFYYGKAKNPNHRGIWRNRSSKCVISELVSPSVLDGQNKITIPAVLKEICSGVTKNCHGEQFIKAVGRRLAFLKALDVFPEQELRRNFMEAFEDQCKSSANNTIRLHTKMLVESLP